MTIRSHFTAPPRVRAFVTALCALTLATAALGAEPLRVCADPDNLPFSKSEGGERGLYVELAELVAKRLDATPVHYTWWLTFYQRRALRNTAGECDAVFALPTNADYKARGLKKTQPFLEVGYALVAAPSFQFSSLNDLKGKRLAVQYQTTPHILLSQLEGFTFSTYRTTDEVLDVLAKGEVDAAFLWGPVAGYENQRRHGNRWKVTPLTGSDMNGQVSVAVRGDKPVLIKDIEAALLVLQPEITALADKYGFPRGKAVNIVDADSPPGTPSSGPSTAQGSTVTPAPAVTEVVVQKAAEATPAPAKATGSKAATKAKAKPTAPVAAQAAAKPKAPAVAQAPVMSEKALLGRTRVNDQCSHCHGVDGASPIRERDLRRLKTKYEEKWVEATITTIKEGRSDLGMPVWKEILKDSEIQEIMSFLETQQK